MVKLPLSWISTSLPLLNLLVSKKKRPSSKRRSNLLSKNLSLLKPSEKGLPACRTLVLLVALPVLVTPCTPAHWLELSPPPVTFMFWVASPLSTSCSFSWLISGTKFGTKFGTKKKLQSKRSQKSRLLLLLLLLLLLWSLPLWSLPLFSSGMQCGLCSAAPSFLQPGTSLPQGSSRLEPPLQGPPPGCSLSSAKAGAAAIIRAATATIAASNIIFLIY